MKPSNRRGLRLLSLWIALVWSGVVSGQGETRMNTEELMSMRAQVSERLQKHYIRVKGTEQPEAIPFPAKMRTFISSWQPQRLSREALVTALRERVRLAEADALLLAGSMAAKQAPIGLAELSAQTKQVSEALATTVDANETIRLARELDKIEERSNALWQGHYDAMLSALSSDARKTINEYLHNVIAPGMTYVRVDHVGLYSEALQLLPQIKILEQAGFAKVPAPNHASSADASSATGFVGQSNVD